MGRERERESESGRGQDQEPRFCLSPSSEMGLLMVPLCPSSCTMGPSGDVGHEASLQSPPLPLPITVPFKATQHLFPPIKTNNLFCRKSQQLLSAAAEACWMACNCRPEVLSLVYFFFAVFWIRFFFFFFGLLFLFFFFLSPPWSSRPRAPLRG